MGSPMASARSGARERAQQQHARSTSPAASPAASPAKSFAASRSYAEGSFASEVSSRSVLSGAAPSPTAAARSSTAIGSPSRSVPRAAEPAAAPRPLDPPAAAARAAALQPPPQRAPQPQYWTREAGDGKVEMGTQCNLLDAPPLTLGGGVEATRAEDSENRRWQRAAPAAAAAPPPPPPATVLPSSFKSVLQLQLEQQRSAVAAALALHQQALAGRNPRVVLPLSSAQGEAPPPKTVFARSYSIPTLESQGECARPRDAGLPPVASRPHRAHMYCRPSRSPLSQQCSGTAHPSRRLPQATRSRSRR